MFIEFLLGSIRLYYEYGIIYTKQTIFLKGSSICLKKLRYFSCEKFVYPFKRLA